MSTNARRDASKDDVEKFPLGFGIGKDGIGAFGNAEWRLHLGYLPFRRQFGVDQVLHPLEKPVERRNDRVEVVQQFYPHGADVSRQGLIGR